ncbi:MAG: hypothetical protein O6700_05385 [Gammaproteobacteria bacterium]|nr:hypothetical protein [Gammaproteobacteria bacterium]
MLRFLQRLLGWNTHPTALNPEGTERRRIPRTTVSSVLTDYTPQPATNTDAETAKPGVSTRDPQLSMNKPGDGNGDAGSIAAGENDSTAWDRAKEWRNG